MSIGTLALALEIDSYNWHERENIWGELDRSDHFPAGWQYLGSGSFRHAFRGPDGNVYKVHTKISIENYDSNENKRSMDEYLEKSERVQTAGVKMALTNLIHNVMVQEYIDAEPTNMLHVTLVLDALSSVRVTPLDISGSNLRVVDGVHVLIDW